MPPKTLAIDLFTLISSAPITSTLSTALPHLSPSEISSTATSWRKTQIDSTLRLASMGAYTPFTNILSSSLSSVLPSLPASTKQVLEHAYATLPLYPDVAAFLTELTTKGWQSRCYLHANADPLFMQSLVKANPLLEHFFAPERIISTEDVKSYKPARIAYDAFCEKAGVAVGDTVLVSAHEWDVVGAGWAGWGSVWVDREGGGWKDGVGGLLGIGPGAVVGGLEGVLQVVEGLK